MPFLRKKTIKFAVELIVSRLTDVSLLNARIFSKVRLLDGGSFEAVTETKELRGHTCILYTPDPSASAQPVSKREALQNGHHQEDENAENRPTTSSPQPLDDLITLTTDQSDRQPFRFLCRIPYNPDTLRLEECRCKISIRKIERASKHTKLGFVIINLSEFASASATPATQSYILDGYTNRQRQDNSRVHIQVRMVNQMPDPLFKLPTQNTPATSLNDIINPYDRKVVQKEEHRRRHEEAERPGSAAANNTAASSNIPQSTTLNSFSSASTSGDSTAAGANSQHSPSGAATLRFSTPLAAAASSERRTSVPSERLSWTTASSAGGADFGSTTSSDYVSRLHHFSDMRRMSDDRIVTAAASQNVPNRIQQTRRDADSVIEEVLAEAAVGLNAATSDDENEATVDRDQWNAADDETLTDQTATLTPKIDGSESDASAKHLELFVSRRNGAALVGSSTTTSSKEEATAGDPQSRSSFERVRIDSTLSG